MIAHVAGGGVLSDLLYVAVSVLIVGLLIVGQARKWGIALICVALVLGAAGGYDIWRSRPKSSSGITLTVLAPVSGSIVPAGQPIEMKVTVKGLTLTPVGAAVNRPGEGHLHTYVDGNLYAMWVNSGTDDTFTLSAGPHQVRVELTTNDHRPLSPAVEQTLQLTAQ